MLVTLRRASARLSAVAVLLVALATSLLGSHPARAASTATRMYAIDANNSMQLYIGDGAGKLTGGGAAWPTPGAWGGFKTFTTADFNNDGWPDVAGLTTAGDMQLFPGSSSGQLGGGSWMWPTGGQWAGFRLISAANPASGPARMYALDNAGDMHLYTSDGAGKLTGGQYVWPTGGQWAGFRLIATADYNGDGWPDVAGLTNDGYLRLYLGNASGQLSGGALMWPSSGWTNVRLITAGDFNSDGAADILGIDNSGDMRLYPGDRAGHLVTSGGALAWPAGGGWSGSRQIAASAVVPACTGTRTAVEVLGDSYAHGSGDPAGDGLTVPLAAKINATTAYGCSWMYGGSQPVGNAFYAAEGYPGATIAQVASHLPGCLSQAGPAGLDVGLVIVMASANDAGQNRTGQQMLDDMSALVDKALAATAGVKVMVVGQPIIAINTAAQQAAQTTYDDGLPGMLAPKGARVTSVDARGVQLSTDGVHPSPTGYGQIADKVDTARRAHGWLP